MIERYFTYPRSRRKVLNPQRISSTAEYIAWGNLKDRCLREKGQHWPNYGGRGIGICPRWLESFWNFYDDMGPRPSPEHSVERDDVDKGYEPSNCRWATQPEQARNRRTNVRITAFGRTMVLADWAREGGIPAETIRGRLKSGWRPEDAVIEPPRKHQAAAPPAEPKRRGSKPFVTVTAFGQTKLLVDWADEYDLSPPTLSARLRMGWSPEEALTTKVRKKKRSKK